MEIASFEDLLRAARIEPEPQRLLFVFARAHLPEHATELQHAQFASGEGGELAPLMCVDKDAAEIASFAALADEASQAGPPWAIVFAAALSGRNGIAPTAADAEAALQRMVESVKAGRLRGMLPFDRHGEPVHLA